MPDITRRGRWGGPEMMRADTNRSWLEVDLAALRRNANSVASRAGGFHHLLPMVKADAYGLGAVSVARVLGELGVWALGVATAGEGEELRQAGFRERIVVFTPCAPVDGPRLAASKLEPAVTSLAALSSYAQLSVDDGLSVHLEVDTGMGRFGLLASQAESWAPRVKEVLSSGSVRLASTFTHFHSSETNPKTTTGQWSCFLEAVEAMRAVGIEPGPLHAANTAAVLRHPETHADLVRPGLYLYGAVLPKNETPSMVETSSRDGKNVAGEIYRPEPVVSVRARVLDVREVPAGTTVSYGATFTTTRPSRLATLGVGYADGMPHALSNRGHVIVAGRRVPIRGAVCMDMTIADVSGMDDVQPGHVATVLGREGSVEISLEEVAECSHTIVYEILTGFSTRLPRVVVDTTLNRGEGDRRWQTAVAGLTPHGN